MAMKASDASPTVVNHPTPEYGYSGYNLFEASMNVLDDIKSAMDESIEDYKIEESDGGQL